MPTHLRHPESCTAATEQSVLPQAQMHAGCSEAAISSEQPAHVPAVKASAPSTHLFAGALGALFRPFLPPCASEGSVPLRVPPRQRFRTGPRAPPVPLPSAASATPAVTASPSPETAPPPPGACPGAALLGCSGAAAPVAGPALMAAAAPGGNGDSTGTPAAVPVAVAARGAAGAGVGGPAAGLEGTAGAAGGALVGVLVEAGTAAAQVGGGAPGGSPCESSSARASWSRLMMPAGRLLGDALAGASAGSPFESICTSTAWLRRIISLRSRSKSFAGSSCATRASCTPRRLFLLIYMFCNHLRRTRLPHATFPAC